jgi:hypothetical protein
MLPVYGSSAPGGLDVVGLAGLIVGAAGVIASLTFTTIVSARGRKVLAYDVDIRESVDAGGTGGEPTSSGIPPKRAVRIQISNVGRQPVSRSDFRTQPTIDFGASAIVQLMQVEGPGIMSTDAVTAQGPTGRVERVDLDLPLVNPGDTFLIYALLEGRAGRPVRVTTGRGSGVTIRERSHRVVTETHLSSPVRRASERAAEQRAVATWSARVRGLAAIFTTLLGVVASSVALVIAGSSTSHQNSLFTLGLLAAVGGIAVIAAAIGAVRPWSKRTRKGDTGRPTPAPVRPELVSLRDRLMMQREALDVLTESQLEQRRS